MIREAAGVMRAGCGRALVALAGVFLSAALGASVAGQTNAPATAPASSAAPAVATATPANPPTVKENSATPAAPPPPKKRKVFTDDDVPALRAKGGIANDDDAGAVMIYGTMGACDAECEQEVKNQLGVTEEQEGEWKLQMTAARREIGEDRQWREMYWKGQQAMKRVCTLRTQIENVPAPSGNDYQSRLERAKQMQMFQEAEKSAMQQAQSVATGMSQYVQQFAEREPVRAVMMAVIGERLLGDCPDEETK